MRKTEWYSERRRLNSKIRVLEKDGNFYYREMAERGKEIEKLRTLVEGGKDLIDPELHESMMKPIMAYIIRNAEKNSVHYNKKKSKLRRKL